MKVDISYIYEREVGLGLDVGFDKVTMVWETEVQNHHLGNLLKISNWYSVLFIKWTKFSFNSHFSGKVF